MEAKSLATIDAGSTYQAIRGAMVHLVEGQNWVAGLQDSGHLGRTSVPQTAQVRQIPVPRRMPEPAAALPRWKKAPFRYPPAWGVGLAVT